MIISHLNILICKEMLDQLKGQLKIQFNVKMMACKKMTIDLTVKRVFKFFKTAII